MKFEQGGFHPIEGRPLNLIELINQTFTYLVALRATAWLLRRHPEAGGFKLAPGAAALMPIDIMSIVPGLVGAETFAAVHPDNNASWPATWRSSRASRTNSGIPFSTYQDFDPVGSKSSRQKPGSRSIALKSDR
jgi:hypothetical protein